MASTKRVASAAAEQSAMAAKACKAGVKLSAGTMSMITGVVEAIDAAEGLGAECKTMLRAGCALSLGVPADQRHEEQRDVVEMIGEVLNTSLGKLQTAVEHAETQFASQESQRIALQQEAVEQASELERSAAELERARADATAAMEVERAAASALAKARQVQSADDQKAHALTQQRDRVVTGMDKHLVAVRTADLEAAEVIQHAKFLTDLASGMQMDDSLAVSVPKVCAKIRSERKSFDEMVLDAFEKALKEQLATLDAELAIESPHVTERAAAVASAQEGAKVAADAAAASSKQCKEAEATSKQCGERVAAAKEAVLHCQVEAERRSKACDAAKAALDQFKAWPLECFNTLKDRIVKQPDVPASEGGISASALGA